MSNIIAFEPKRGGRAAAQPVSDAVQILFFTGVRYVREYDVEIAGPDDRAQAPETAREADRDHQAERLLA